MNFKNFSVIALIIMAISFSAISCGKKAPPKLPQEQTEDITITDTTNANN